MKGAVTPQLVEFLKLIWDTAQEAKVDMNNRTPEVMCIAPIVLIFNRRVC
jgi:hypothetical protein